MGEAMDAADMPGLHLKLHRNLGDDFNIFRRFVDLFGLQLAESIEGVLHSLMKMMTELTEICE